MHVDLKKDALKILKYLKQRAKDYPVYVNAGPGQDEDDIRLITLGFQLDQAGWVALVFDTRPKAKNDGRWQQYIEENALLFEPWHQAFLAMDKKGGAMSLTDHQGNRHTFKSNAKMEVVAACFGEMCKDLLQKAVATGLFKKLPLDKDVQLCVEEHEGAYGWLTGQEDAASEETEASVMQAMQQAAKKLPKDKQLNYWLCELDCLASHKPCLAAKLVYCEDFVLNELKAFGASAVLALLKWTQGWANTPEYDQNDEDAPHANVVFKVFQQLMSWKTVPAEAETLIQDYIRTATSMPPVLRKSDGKGKTKRPVFAIVPAHAAWLLHSRYRKYPEPKVDPKTCELMNAQEFLGSGKK